MNSNFGLPEKDVESIVRILVQQPEVQEAFIFGSRAKGNFKNGSDVDLALKGEKLSFKIVSNISYLLNEETQMPYKFDVIDFNSIKNNDLINHINRVGKMLYSKPPT